MPGSRIIDANVRVRSTPVVLTPEIAREVVGRAAFIARADHCPCREERHCKDYPSSHGCLYLGDGARGIVANAGAREIGREEAIEHLLQAETLGLVHMVLWTSDELRSLGAGAKRALELCACCPCCCISRRTGGGMQAYVDGMAGLGIARADGECAACGACEKTCAFKAITIDDDGPAINLDRCKGCGLCESACRQGVMKVYPLEMVPSFSGGWQMVPASEFIDEITRTIG